ncbi:hypothetical protein DFJ58DRAFT_915287 [Suillus subalutaceus]|uniref:uncharacterized protein n=1 Tax=Suillus subalutaceus TaxID=48586 RepID=UPI001B874996|nr:uncharacterized protein DFJ58DRAFT_915287 [Suillus subalutaceus]KAG1846758.1 hypothetical protein DFJ58DRAFT_915287 [Suillus subalutaceus]
MASGSYGGTARIWNLDTGKLVAGPFQSDDTTGVGAVRFSQDSKKLAVKSNIAKWLEVWDVETQKLDVSLRVGKDAAVDWLVSYAPVFWTAKDKTVVAVLDFNGDNDSSPCHKTVCEFDALTLKTVGAPFEGHTGNIYGLALSFDCALLASACSSTVKLWAFESRQLLASFDVQFAYSLLLSPNSLQLAYSTGLDTNIYICDIPPKIIATIWPNTSEPKNLNILNSNATRRAVPRKPVISPVTAPWPQRPPTTQRRDFFHYLRIVLPSRTNARGNDQHRDPLDFPATSPLPHKYSHSAQEATKTHSRMNPYENSQPPITQSSTTFKARLRDLRTGHALSPIVGTPLAQGKERNAAADAPPKNNKDWIPYEDHVPSRPPSPNPDSQPRHHHPQCKSTPESMGVAGHAAASKLVSQASSNTDIRLSTTLLSDGPIEIDNRHPLVAARNEDRSCLTQTFIHICTLQVMAHSLLQGAGLLLSN